MPDAHADTARYNYNFTAWFYQQLAAIYSFGQIGASKACQVERMRHTDRVLYAGVGTGEDAILAARKGVELTCVDLSRAMLVRTQRKVARERLRGEFICGDIMRHERPGHYDVVCANFFLNVFHAALMPKVLAHLVTLLKPGGSIMIADFSLPRGNPVSRALHVAYYRIANIFYWALSGNDLHPIYDYPSWFPQFGIEHVDTKTFRLLGIGPAYYHSVFGRKTR
jgi:demethylmenaquinone methyltransferase/2-methoxy-6-polyprenyl-1,4-benzoquinol methylase